MSLVTEALRKVSQEQAAHAPRSADAVGLAVVHERPAGRGRGARLAACAAAVLALAVVAVLIVFRPPARSVGAPLAVVERSIPHGTWQAPSLDARPTSPSEPSTVSPTVAEPAPRTVTEHAPETALEPVPIAEPVASSMPAPSASLEAPAAPPAPAPLPELTPELFADGQEFEQTFDVPGFTSLKLLGVVHSEQRKLAMINGRILRVGESVGQAKIVAIEPQCVTLRIEGKTVRLRMP